MILATRGKREMSKLALRRRRRPIGGRLGSLELDAKCVAGWMNPRWVCGAVKRIAWSMWPRWISSYRIRPAKIERPAASADVQPSGRSLFERRLKTAPEPAFHEPSAFG